MDIKRPDAGKRRYRRLAMIGAAAAGVVALAVVALQLAQRPPGVDRDQVWDGAVASGEFVHEVTAAGALFAPEIRSVTARSNGVVERVNVLAGHVVGADDVLIELSSPQLAQELAQKRTTLAQAEATETIRRADSEDEYLNLLVTLASAEAEYTTAQLEAEAQRILIDMNASSNLEAQRTIARAAQLERRLQAAQAKLDRYPETRAIRDASEAAKLDQQRRDVKRLEDQINELQVRAGVAGVIQQVDAEIGKRVSEGAEVARVVNPENLIARVRVSERDAALVEVGQAVRLEMGRQTVQGKVTRVEPTVRERLVTVDVALLGEGHTGLRPDLTVTARIEIDRAVETLVLDRPAGLRDDQTKADLFRLDDAGRRAERVSVGIGRISARQVEIASGLKAGDRVILADMTEWLEESEIRIR